MKCSIIVANYNNGKYLPELIESVRNQTYADWEIVIVDDASTDNSLKVVKRYLPDNRIKLIKKEKNTGVGDTKRLGVENATGEIVVILDADDALVTTAIEEIVKSHKKNPNAAMIIANLIVTDTNLNKTGKIIKFPIIQNNITVLNQIGLTGWDTFKKQFYDKTEGFDSELKSAVDQDIYFKMEEVGELKALDKDLYLYRTNPKGISQQNNKSFAHEYNYLAIIKAYKRRKKTGFKNISEERYKEVLMNYHYLKFVNAYKRGELKSISKKEEEILTKFANSRKAENINEINAIFNLLETLNFEKKDLIKQKIIKSYFIKKRYNSKTARELFNKKATPNKYFSTKDNFKILLKSILNWKVK